MSGDEPDDDGAKNEGSPGASEESGRRVRLKRVVEPARRKKVRLVKKAEREEEVAEEEEGDGDEDEEGSSGEDDIWFDGMFENDIDPEHPEEGVRHILGAIAEKVVPKLIKRIVAAGGEKLTETDLRQIIRDTPLPRDVTGLVAGQIGHAREEILRILAQEIQKFLETLNISQELQKLLTSVSFEIRTEIRFIPNDKSTSVKPNVKNRVKVRRARQGEGEEEGEA